jgi:uncharacterized protein YecT (DUF1311 family)
MGAIAKRRSRIRLPLIALAALLAAGEARAAITLPPIHESFTLLPCPKSAQTTLDMEGCAEHAIVRSDARIDTLRKQILKQLYDNAARRRFVAGEQAWFRYRQAFCTSQSDLYERGTDAGVVAANCEATVNDQHVAALATFHKELSGP